MTPRLGLPGAIGVRSSEFGVSATKQPVLQASAAGVLRAAKLRKRPSHFQALETRAQTAFPRGACARAEVERPFRCARPPSNEIRRCLLLRQFSHGELHSQRRATPHWHRKLTHRSRSTVPVAGRKLDRRSVAHGNAGRAGRHIRPGIADTSEIVSSRCSRGRKAAIR